MKKLISILKDVHEENKLVHQAIFEQRLKGLIESYEDGTLKYYFIGGILVGTGLSLYGILTTNEILEYFGYGMGGMAIISGTPIYYRDLINKLRKRK